MRLSHIQKSTSRIDPNQTSCHRWRCFPFTLGRSRSEQGRYRRQRRGEEGFTTLGASLLFLTFLAGVGSFLIFNQVGSKIKTQIEMDQFTGETATELRAALITLDESQTRLKAAQLVMSEGCISFPPSCIALKNAYELHRKVEQGIQKIAEAHWDTQKIKWLTYRPLRSQKNQIPGFPGSSLPSRVHLKLQMGSLTSVAEIWSIPKGVLSHDWKIAWTQ